MTGKCRGLGAGKCILWRLTICPRSVIGLNCLGTGFARVRVCAHRGVCVYEGGEGLSALRRGTKVQSCVHLDICFRWIYIVQHVSTHGNVAYRQSVLREGMWKADSLAVRQAEERHSGLSALWEQAGILLTRHTLSALAKTSKRALKRQQGYKD